MPKGLFVAGTDTGVGKTLVACALIRILRERGVDAVGFKPVATGQESGRWPDAEALREASGETEPVERICPLRYKAPLSPLAAAKLEGAVPDLGLARRALVELSARHACVVAEGIGGLLVPLDRTTLLLNFIQATGFPVVLVARAGVGTISHTLLSLRELERARVSLAALIVNVTRKADEGNVAHCVPEIEHHAWRKVSAVIPYLGPEEAHESSYTTWLKDVLKCLAEKLDVPGLTQ
jgi:dethiobiotin synthetase